MYKFIIATFLMLGWAFYEFSGGSDFEPGREIVAETTIEEIAPVIETTEEAVASASVPIIEDTAPAEEVTVAAVTLDTTPVVDPIAAEPEIQTLASISAALESAAAAEATPEATASTLTFEPTQVTASAASADIRSVAGSRVNMRSGPGTDYGVLATLPRGTEAEVLEVDVTGWARIRIIGSGQIGWMAERLLQTL